MTDSFDRIFSLHICRPMSVHSMTLASFRLSRKNLGNLREFFGQMVHRPSWQKTARTPMAEIEPMLLWKEIPADTLVV